MFSLTEILWKADQERELALAAVVKEFVIDSGGDDFLLKVVVEKVVNGKDIFDVEPLDHSHYRFNSVLNSKGYKDKPLFTDEEQETLKIYYKQAVSDFLMKSLVPPKVTVSTVNLRGEDNEKN